jgi:hypothetical protein
LEFLDPDLDLECVPRSGSSNIAITKTERKKIPLFSPTAAFQNEILLLVFFKKENINKKLSEIK